MRAALLSPGFPSYPRGVKKSQTINPLTLAPACRTGWMHQRNGTVYLPKPVCWRSACRILPEGSQSLLSSSRACLAPHHSSKALGSSAHSSLMNPHQNFYDSSGQDQRPPCTLQPGTKETWGGGEVWDTTQGNALRLSLSIPATIPASLARPKLSEYSSTHP